MDKVKVTKKVAEAFDAAKRRGLGHEDQAKMVRLHMKGPIGWTGHCKPLNGLDLDTFIRALYIGYEVEHTPESQVRDIYQFWDNYHGDAIYSGQTIASHISDVLNILNIKIEGVNA